MKLIFMGSPTFAVPSLKALVAAGHEIVAVYTQPPRPAGRGQKLTPTAIQTTATELGLANKIRSPERLKGEALDELLTTPCDVMCVVAYGQILSQAVLNHALCLNVHFSALPRWRGAAPVQHAILAGDSTIEVTIAKMELQLDSGPVYLRKEFPLPNNATSSEIYTQMAHEGAPMLVETVAHLHDWTPIPQSTEGITLAPKITPTMRPLDFTKPATALHNQVRALAPTPAATAVLGGEVCKILATVVMASPVSEYGVNSAWPSHTPGTILRADTELHIACGKDILRILSIQRPNNKPMAVEEALRGWKVV